LNSKINFRQQANNYRTFERNRISCCFF
jgi:Predicted permease